MRGKEPQPLVIAYNTSHYIYLFRRPLIEALQRDGFEVHAVCPTDPYTSRLVQLGVLHTDVPISNKGLNPFKDLQFTWAVWRAYRRIRPAAALHFTIKPNIYATIVARIMSVPVISTITGLGTAFIRPGLLQSISKMLYRAALGGARHVFFQNKFDRDAFVRWGITPECKTSIVGGSGVNATYFHPSPKAVTNPFLFLYIGRMLADKGLYELVEAMRLLKARGHTCECRLVGQLGSENRTAISREQMAAWESEGLVKYVGEVDDVRVLVEVADCVVLPSYREGTSKTLLEAAAMAKPLIASDVPGCNNVVLHERSGYLCEVRSAADLALKMAAMIALTDESRAAMGAAGREHILSNFSEAVVVNLYMNKIKEVTSGLK